MCGHFSVKIGDFPDFRYENSEEQSPQSPIFAAKRAIQNHWQGMMEKQGREIGFESQSESFQTSQNADRQRVLAQKNVKLVTNR